jgi:hypothetical protein
MSLIDLQSALGCMVVAQASDPGRPVGAPASFQSLNLSVEERGWLAQLADSPGFKVTCKIQRWWRQTKLQMAAKLTLSALGADRSAEFVNNYLNASPCISLFFVPEAVGFLEFVAGDAAGLPHVVEVARFERALLLAKQAAIEAASSSPSDSPCDRAHTTLRPHPAADMVLFAASPESVLGALLGDQPLPDEQMRKSPILIAPKLARLWRPATDDEYRLFESSRQGVKQEQLVAMLSRGEETLKELLRAGAFCVQSEK